MALAPNEVLVIANGNVPENKHLADYYMTKRNSRSVENKMVIELSRGSCYFPID